MLSAPVDVFDCRDGQIYVAVLLDSHWRVLSKMIGRAELAGVLATVCSPEKKIIHGMKDAIMAPCALAPDSKGI